MWSRRFIGRGLAVTTLALTVGIALLAWRDKRAPVLHEVIVPVEGLSAEVRILHASDLHSSSFGPSQKRLAALLPAGERFDAAVLTGDLVVCDAEDDARRALELAEIALSRADVVFYTPGNHDGDALGTALSALGVIDLTGAPPATTIASGAGSVLVASPWTRDDHPGVDLLILASHYPFEPDTLAGFATSGRTTAVLAGHTHGGQVRLPLIGALAAPGPISWTEPDTRRPGHTDWLFPDLRGLHVEGLYEEAGVYQHVSGGLGTHAVPLRFGARSSMTVVRFVPADAAGAGL